MRKYLIFDTETGGFNAKKTALLSVAGILVDEMLQPLERFNVFLANTYDREIGTKALEINHIDPESIPNGVSVPEFVEMFQPLVDRADGGFMCHNSAFDYPFVIENGITIPEKVLDTCHMSWDIWGLDESAKLINCYKRIGYDPGEKAHHADFDCEMTLKLLQWFADNKKLKLPPAMFTLPKGYYKIKAFGYRALLLTKLVERAN